jgi:pilus assembly protein CpaF
MNLRLVVEDLNGHLLCQHALGPEPITVGRALDCGLTLEDDTVSRYHLTLSVRGSELDLVDTSRNGTMVGARLLIGGQALVPLDTPLLLGHTRLTIAPSEQELSKVVPALVPPAVRAIASTPAILSEHVPPARVPVELRREVHRRLLQHLELGADDLMRLDAAALRPRVIRALRRILEGLRERLPLGLDSDALLGELVDEALGLGPLEHLLADPSVSEVMVVDPRTIFVEQNGKCVRSPASFTDDERVRAVIERIVTPLGRRIDESSPLVDARLPDGSRVNAVIKPLALRGSCITIRKFPKNALGLEQLVNFGTLTASMARFLARSVMAKKNIVVSGGTGSGKTTLLNALSANIPEAERIITIEDAAELQLNQEHVVSLETRPANLEGKGAYTIRDLVKNALRMRPDRIIVGECRGGETLDMLQAMNTGHEGSLTTVHANSPAEACARLETLSLMAGLDLPARAIREQIATSVHLVVQQRRLQDGSRKITAISEIAGLGKAGQLLQRPLYLFNQEGIGARGEVLGTHEVSGYLPSFLGEFLRRGLIAAGESYL